MNVGVFVPESNMMHINALLAFAEGISRVHPPPKLYDIHDYHPVDVAVVFGIGKKEVPVSWPRGKIIAEQRARGKDVIVIERGFVRRAEYFMVGLNGLNGRAEFYNNASPPDRWNALEVELKPLRPYHPDSHIIVCGQVPTDASVQNVNIVHWCGDITLMLRKMTKRKILFRPHPLARDRTPHILGASTSLRPYEEDLVNAWAVVTYNSNAAVEAVIKGVPALYCDKGSMAQMVAGDDFATIEDPYFPEDNSGLREQWAHNLAYTQWNMQEFRAGLPWMHLMSRGLRLEAV